MTTSVAPAKKPVKSNTEAKTAAITEAPWWSKINLTVEEKFGGWSQRSGGYFVLGMVRVSDGKWVLPPIKCKEYLQDTVLTKYLKQSFGACGYIPKTDDIVGQKLAIVFGFPRVLETTKLLTDMLRAGASSFNKHVLPDAAITITPIEGTLTVSGWQRNSVPEEWDPVVVEYDDKIESHPAMFSLFVSFLRAGFAVNTPAFNNPKLGTTNIQPNANLGCLDGADYVRAEHIRICAPRFEFLLSKVGKDAEANYQGVMKAGCAGHSSSGWDHYKTTSSDF
jgi:hypothetical protein